MNTQAVYQEHPSEAPVSEAAEVGRIILGAIGGALAGLCFGAVVYQSWVVALAGALGGAVFGMIGGAKHSENQDESALGA